jgi:hypothetical protein
MELTGCVEWPAGVETGSALNEIRAFPVPAGEQVSIPVPVDGTFSFKVLSADGKIVCQGFSSVSEGKLKIDVGSVISGSYLIVLKSQNGQVFRVKMVKF